MKKTMLVAMRECRLRLRRPSFWVLTVLVPLVLAALYALPVVAAGGDGGPALVLLVDETGLFERSLRGGEEVAFRPVASMELARREMDADDAVAAILFVPMRETTIPRDAFLYHRGSVPPPALQLSVGAQLQMVLRQCILEDVYGLEPEAMLSVSMADIRLHARDAATGGESFARVRGVVASVLAVLMVLALVVFGVQVMRSVQEERASRVAEVVASSVRPVQLMVGKVGGVAVTAVVQLALWVMLTAAAIGGVQASHPALFAQAREQQSARMLATKGAEATAQYHSSVQLVDETVQGLTAINLPLVAAVFFVFFLLGYLLYGAFLAALAVRLDSDADALQWVLLVLSPLLLVLMVIPLVLQAPGGLLAGWLSVIPFTAPAAMMLRLPFGISSWQVVLAAVLLAVFFLGAALLAARSYKRHFFLTFQ